jgi:diaminopimelate decarboxylase
MSYLEYINHTLRFEQLNLQDLAEQFPTPFYCYSYHATFDNYQNFAKCLSNINHMICFAVKANPNLATLNLLAGLGSGADCVSEGEIRRALKAGILPSKIVFSGVAKTTQEMDFALSAGIFQFNVESEAEVRALSARAYALNKTATIALRINPDVVADTHQKITTGMKGNKFGIDQEQALKLYGLASTLPGIVIQGISMHIGSQILSLHPFREAFTKMRELYLELTSQGHNITTIDLGGGIGIRYGDETTINLVDYAKLVEEILGDLDCQFIFEPGRLITGNAGILVTQVIYIKQSGDKCFALVDAGMNDLLRPALYEAVHEIIPVKYDASLIRKYDIAGPVCESSDILGVAKVLPDLMAGDLLVIKSVGAYGASMSSCYNSRLLIPEVMVKGDQWKVVRKRGDFEEMLSGEKVVEW